MNLAPDRRQDALGCYQGQTALGVNDDSDLAYPLKVIQEFGIKVIQVNPLLASHQGAAGLRRIRVHRRQQRQAPRRRHADAVGGQFVGARGLHGLGVHGPTGWGAACSACGLRPGHSVVDVVQVGDEPDGPAFDGSVDLSSNSISSISNFYEVRVGGEGQ